MTVPPADPLKLISPHHLPLRLVEDATFISGPEGVTGRPSPSARLRRALVLIVPHQPR